MAFEIELDVPLLPLESEEFTAFICRRTRKATPIKTRKFLADCGTKIIVDIGARGGILGIAPEYPCDAGKNCPRCKDRIDKIRSLIESGK